MSKDELTTLLAEATAIVNETPLWEVSPDPNDVMPLTPSMLLTLKQEPHPSSREEFSHEDFLAYGKRRWRRVQALADNFWSNWQTGHLATMQERRKWLHPNRNVQPGDVVLIRDKNLKRNQWPMARVSETKKSDDGLVRSATLKVAKAKGDTVTNHYYERPICDLVLLLKGEQRG